MRVRPELPATEDTGTFYFGKIGEEAVQRGPVRAWRAVRQPLQRLMGLAQLGRGSLGERRSWLGETAGSHMGWQGDFQNEGPMSRK